MSAICAVSLTVFNCRWLVAGSASELQRQYQQTLEDSRLESSRQAATARAKPVEQQARKSWDVSEIKKRDVGKAQKCYNHALALDPNNKELRAKVRVVDAARYAEKQRCPSKIVQYASTCVPVLAFVRCMSWFVCTIDAAGCYK